MDEIEKLTKEIEDWKESMYIESMANDFYYTKGSYYPDKKHLEEMERELKRLKQNV